MRRAITAKLLAAATCLMLATPTHAADEISASYDVLFAGARIMKANYSATLNDGAYTAALDAKTVGATKWLSKIKLNLNASGRISNAKITPTSYNYSRKKNDKRRERSLAFGPNGALITQGADYGEGIMKVMSTSVMDPLSMLLKLSRNSSPCSGKHRAFDGRDVFDISLSTGSKSGNAITCKVTYTPVAGGEVDDGDVEPKFYEITLVPMGSVDGYIPVRIAGTTKGVGFDVSATGVSINGAPLSY